jgi:hypothetical protein
MTVLTLRDNRRGRWPLPRRAAAFWREPKGVRAEPGKQKPRSCRAQEISLKQCPEKMSGRKRLA